MLKKELEFIEKYKADEEIYFKENKCYIQDKAMDTLEIRELSEKIKDSTCFSAKNFTAALKKVHGAKHSFSILSTGLQIQTKKEKEIVEEITIETLSPYPIKIPKFELIGTFNQDELASFDTLKKMTTSLEYVNFLNHPTFIIDKKELYIWSTDCIHQLKLNGKGFSNQYSSFQINKEFCIKIKKFTEKMKKANLYMNEKYLAIANDDTSDNSLFIFPYMKTTDSYPCCYKKGQEYTLSETELKKLKEIPFKTILPAEKEKVKVAYKVVLEIIKGSFYIQKKKVYEINKDITVSKPIEAYNFYELLKKSRSIAISQDYLRFNDETILIL